MTLVVDYGRGNIASVVNMLRRVGVAATISSNPAEISAARKLILPGVGSFDAGMKALVERGHDRAILEAVESGATLLGICLGMQLLLDGSDEGSCKGLGLISGKAERFDAAVGGIRIPHMGWNVVRPQPRARLFSTGPEESRFYFVHSYFARCTDPADVAALTHYGKDFASAVQKNHVYGVQFHPEKSHRFGMELLRCFEGS